jgi:hypothetical protein
MFQIDFDVSPDPMADRIATVRKSGVRAFAFPGRDDIL